MKTDLSKMGGDFIPSYNGWENDFDELCRKKTRITVKLAPPDVPAGAKQEVQRRARKNGFTLMAQHSNQQASFLFFTKPAGK